jgi:hypothetical protein
MVEMDTDANNKVPTIQDSINIYYKKLMLHSKLSSRKGSETISPG